MLTKRSRGLFMHFRGNMPDCLGGNDEELGRKIDDVDSPVYHQYYLDLEKEYPYGESRGDGREP
jgi:hypothetical protein